MNNLVEKNLKRFVKRKVTFTLGMMVAFLITGSLGYAVTNVPIVVNTGEVKEINDLEFISKVTNGNPAFSLGTIGGELNINSNKIKLDTSNYTGGFAYGVVAQDGGKLNLGNNNTENIDINVGGDNFIIGVYADKSNNEGKGGEIALNSKNISINVHAIGDGRADGIYSITKTTDLKDGMSIVDIKSDNLLINVSSEKGKANGITAWSQGQVKIDSKNVVINADNAINTRGNSLVEINKENKADSIVQINGDIVFEYNATSSGTTADSNVVINLNNGNSFFNGNIAVTGNPTGENANVDGMSLGVSNGAQWTTDSDSFVNNLTMNNGIINIKGGEEQNIKVDNFSGSGGTINAETEVKADGSLSTGKIDIGSVAAGNKPTFDINFSGINADDVNKENVTTNGIINGVTNGNITGHVEEGLVKGEITVDSNGNTTQKDSNTTLGLGNIAAINFLTWRQEMSSLNQRMGELRDTQGTSGVWARVYGGEFELDGNYKNKYQTYQVGYDKNYDYAGGKLFLGYLFSYTDGSTDYDLGSGENNSFGAGVYGTWLNNSGHYIDVIAKINRLYNEYDIYANNQDRTQSKGDYINYGVSLSAEYGKRFTLDKVFIEPSIRMDLGKIGHESYTTSSGVRVDQDRMYTAQGSLGAKLGYKLDKGNIYARLSGVKEFAGDIDMRYQLGNTSTTHSEDFGDEWLEFGVGGNYRVAENVNLYLDLARTTDATVDTNWQANLGFRWEL